MNDELFNKLKQIAKNQGSPYKNIKLIGDKLIIVLSDGQIVTKDGATEEDYYAIVEAKTKTEIKNKIYVENSGIENQTYVSSVSYPTIKKVIKSRINKIN
jgi:hypothetical protein